MGAKPYALLGLVVAACGGAAPAVPVAAPSASATPSALVAASVPPASASATAPPAPAARATLVAQAKVDAVGLGWTADGARVALTKGGVLALREGRDLTAVAGLTGGAAKAPKGFGPVLAASKGTLLVVEGVPFELPSGRRLELALPKGCDAGAAFSADGSRASADCSDASSEFAVVIDTATGAVLGRFDEYRSAAPVRSGSITASGKFLQWRARASGAFEEISSHVTGPELGSEAIMSEDERYLYLGVNLDWFTDDRTPPKIVTSKDGKVVTTLPHWVRAVDFSPHGNFFLARASSRNEDVAKEAPRRSDLYQTGTGHPLVSVDVPAIDVAKAAFSADERKLAILTKDGTLRVYALEVP
jgi:hypothetical protein